MGFSIGVDFGSLSARAMAVDVSNGRILKESVYGYPHGIMKESLPTGRKLEPGTALQDPRDYLDAWQFLIQDMFKDKELRADQVVGIGIDFTQCTMMPVDREGIPLCMHTEFRDDPHSYVKLWMHHHAQKEADDITREAGLRQERFLKYYGSKISSELLFPKILEILRLAPDIYQAADQFVEGADWMTWQITGTRMRSKSIAAVAALWQEEEGYPSDDFLRALHPEMPDVKQKLRGKLVKPGTCIGGISKEMSDKTGLPAGTPVACGLGDSHSAFAGSGLCSEGAMLMVIGTSGCDILISRNQIPVEGFCGICPDSAIPGYYAYEAGQACMGDHFQWFIENCLPAACREEAAGRNMSVFQWMDEKAGRLKPGSSGVIALDWWNGCRSVLMDSDLGGCLFGMTLQTRPEEIYRALMEGIAFGKRMIIEQMEMAGVRCRQLYATGGVAQKNPLIMQIMADVLGREIKVPAIANGSCMGSAMFGAVAAGRKGGGYDTVEEAVEAMGPPVGKIYIPDQSASAAYDVLFQMYREMYLYMGNSSMLKRLAAMRGKEESTL